MKDNKKTTEKHIGNTVYIVEHDQSSEANETIGEKLERIVINDMGSETIIPSDE